MKMTAIRAILAQIHGNKGLREHLQRVRAIREAVQAGKAKKSK